MKWVGPPTEPLPIRDTQSMGGFVFGDDYWKHVKIRTKFEVCPSCGRVTADLDFVPDTEPTPFLDTDLAWANLVESKRPHETE